MHIYQAAKVGVATKGVPSVNTQHIHLILGQCAVVKFPPTVTVLAQRLYCQDLLI